MQRFGAFTDVLSKVKCATEHFLFLRICDDHTDHDSPAVCILPFLDKLIIAVDLGIPVSRIASAFS